MNTNNLHRAGLFVLCLLCSLAVFLLGPNYYKLFPTNGNYVYAGGLSAILLITALVFKRSRKLSAYWTISYAFFIASTVNLVSDLFAGYNGSLLQFLGILPMQNPWIAMGKVYDAALVILTILVLNKLSGADLGSVFLKVGSNWKWGLGLGALVLANFLTSALIFFGTGYAVTELGAVIAWGAVFAFSNGLLEELWIRGIFLKKLVPFLGTTWTVILSSIWFAVLHCAAVAYLPAAVIPIFLVNTFTLGLACSLLILKTDSLWGAVLVHAAADWFLFIATLAVR